MLWPSWSQRLFVFYTITAVGNVGKKMKTLLSVGYKTALTNLGHYIPCILSLPEEYVCVLRPNLSSVVNCCLNIPISTLIPKAKPRTFNAAEALAPTCNVNIFDIMNKLRLRTDNLSTLNCVLYILILCFLSIYYFASLSQIRPEISNLLYHPV